METLKENLEAIKETVINQKAKINDLDRKVADLERALKNEQAANKLKIKRQESTTWIERAFKMMTFKTL